MKTCKCLAERIKRISIRMFALVSVVLLALPAAAQSPSGFSPRAIIPENQVDKRQTYFDLRLAPGQRQTVQMSITNSESHDIVAHVALSPAATAQNGVVVYNMPDARDESAQFAITDIASVLNPDVVVLGDSTAIVDILIDMPKDTWDGMLLGGLTVTASYPEEWQQNENATLDTGETFVIQNRFAYVVGLKITQNDVELERDLRLKGIEPGLVNYRTAVLVNLQNTQPVLMKGMQLDAQIFAQGSDEILHELHLQNAEMAPNSNGDFAVEWGNDRIDPGTYRLKLRVEHQKQVWEWDEEFTIAGGAAQNVNDEAVNIAVPRPMWPYILLVLLSILLLLAVAYWLGRRTRAKQI